MSIIYSYDVEKGVIFVVWDGEVTWEEWRYLIPRLLADPNWTAISRVIVDLQIVTNTSSIGNVEIDEAASIFGSSIAAVARKRVAAIAKDEFGELISRFGASMVVSNSLVTACVFLGIDPQRNPREAAESAQYTSKQPIEGQVYKKKRSSICSITKNFA